MYFAGVDIGSVTTKVVVINDGTILVSFIGPTGVEHRRFANKVMEAALAQAQLPFNQINFVVATGYGRMNVPFADKQITEISCHAKGVKALFPSARTIFDIGGQDCKGIKLTAEGRVADFVMNDKCGAGSGRFLEVTAEAIGVKLEEMANLSLQASSKAKISNTCAVFAEQEIVSRLGEGVPIPDIIAGLHEALAIRIVNMVMRLSIERDVVLTGGGAKNMGLVRAIAEKLKHLVLVPPEPLITGALGASLLGRELVVKDVVSERKRHLKELSFFK